MTPRVATGPRRRRSTGTPPRPLFAEKDMTKSLLDVTLASDLRMVLIQIDSLRSTMRPDFTIQSGMISVLETASRDLTKTIAEVVAWTDELRAERFARQTASHKAAITRTLRPPLVRRRRR